MSKKKQEQKKNFPGKKWGPSIAVGLLLAMGLIAYSNSFSVPFQWDDRAQILAKPEIQDGTVFSDRSFWLDLHSRPVSAFTFTLNWLVSGRNVVGYHIINLLLHVLTAIMVFVLARFTISLHTDERENGGRVAFASALLVAMLFMLHPIQTMAVTYIIQRMTVMAALFYILGVYLYARGRMAYLHEGSRGRSLLFILFAVVSGILAVMSKQNAATFPAAFLLYELFFIRRPDGRPCPKFLLSGAAVILLAGIAVASAGMLPAETSLFSRLEYFSVQLGIFPRYLLLILFPVHQSADHFIWPSSPLIGPWEVAGILILSGVVILALWLFRRNKLVSFGIFWFLLGMLVESSIIPIRDTMMEHRMYLPMFGFCLVVAGLIRRLIAGRNRAAVYVAGSIVLLALTVATYNRNKVWQSELSLWEDALDKNPENVRAMNNLGHAIRLGALQIQDPGAKRRALERSIAYFSEAMTGDSVYTAAYLNRGLAYLELEAYQRALADIRKIVSSRPKERYLKPYIEGVILAKQGNLREAETKLDESIRLNDDFELSYLWRGLVRSGLDDHRPAIGDFMQYLEMKPGQTVVCINISELYYKLNEPGQALYWITRAHNAGEMVDLRYMRMLQQMVGQ